MCVRYGINPANPQTITSGTQCEETTVAGVKQPQTNPKDLVVAGTGKRRRKRVPGSSGETCVVEGNGPAGENRKMSRQEKKGETV